MKNIFKFAAMAFAAVVMFASCDKKDDKTPDAPAATLDGRVLKVTVENMGDIYFDFGKFAENQITMGMDGAMYGMEGTIIAINPLGSYVVKATDATSGVITRTVAVGDGTSVSQDVPYSGLTETSCTIDLILISMEGTATGEFVDATLVDPFAE